VYYRGVLPRFAVNMQRISAFNEDQTELAKFIILRFPGVHLTTNRKLLHSSTQTRLSVTTLLSFIASRAQWMMNDHIVSSCSSPSFWHFR